MRNTLFFIFIATLVRRVLLLIPLEINWSSEAWRFPQGLATLTEAEFKYKVVWFWNRKCQIKALGSDATKGPDFSKDVFLLLLFCFLIWNAEWQKDTEKRLTFHLMVQSPHGCNIQAWDRLEREVTYSSSARVTKTQGVGLSLLASGCITRKLDGGAE